MSANDPSLLSEQTIYLVAFNYAAGLMIPRLTITRLIKTNLGILVLFPLQLSMMVIITIPCIFMELALGQYSKRTILRIWDLSPIFRGAGFCSFIFFILYQMYYNLFCTYALIFTVLSLEAGPQWKSCNNSWNTIHCYSSLDNDCVQKNCSHVEWQTSVEQFYLNRIMNTDFHSGYLGAPQYELFLCSLLTVLLIFVANSSGRRFFEKVLVISTVAPTIQVLILIFTTLAETGFDSFIMLFEDTSHLSPLRNISNWAILVDAASSGSGLGFGAFITLGTQSSFRTPLRFKSVIISFSIFLCIFVYNITVESFLLSLSIQNNMSVDNFFNVAEQLELPEAFFFLPNANRFWVTMWTLNKYLLGLRSLIVMMFLATEALFDFIPKARKHHTFSVFLFCTLIYYGGFLFSTRVSHFITKSLDAIVCDCIIPFLISTQLIGVVYIYGISNFDNDIDFMLGIKLSPLWKVLIFFNSVIFGSIFSYRVIRFFHQNETVRFKWILTSQQYLLWFSLILVGSYASYHVMKTVIIRKNFKIFRPAKTWGPREESLEPSREMFTKAPELARENIYRQARFRKVE